MARAEVGLLVTAVALCLPFAAGAQSNTDRAQAAFQRAQAAIATEDYPGALAAFREAQELAPHDAVRFNIAICLERMGRFVESLAEFEHAAASVDLSAEQRRDAEQRARGVRARLGRVRVEGPVAGARVSVDGAERCRAPCTVELDPGHHNVSTEGSEVVRAVDLRPGEQLDLAFVPAAPPPPPPPPPPVRRSFGLRVGVPGWIGAGLAVAGTAATTIFGLRVMSLKDDYLADPTRERLDDGRLAVTLTNVSLVVALAGAALFAMDVLFLEGGQPDDPASTPISGPGRLGRALALEW